MTSRSSSLWKRARRARGTQSYIRATWWAGRAWGLRAESQPRRRKIGATLFFSESPLPHPQAYNLETDGGLVGNAFMNVLQPYASRIPFMAVVGNHERASDFAQFKARLDQDIVKWGAIVKASGAKVD
jgi:hypothetical protein